MQKGVRKFSGPGGFTSDPTVNDMGHTTKGNCQKKGKEYLFLDHLLLSDCLG